MNLNEIEGLRQRLIQLYCETTGEGEPVTKEQQQHFIGWLNRTQETLDLELREKVPRNEPMAYTSLSNKISWLSQRKCWLCSTARSDEELFPIVNLPFAAPVYSYQAAHKKPGLVRAYHAAFAEAALENQLNAWPSEKYCVALTFVVRAGKRDRDIDNIAKLAFDGFSRAYDIDDRHIVHADLMKVETDTDEEYVIFRVQPSYLHEHDEVIAPVMHTSLKFVPKLDIEKHM